MKSFKLWSVGIGIIVLIALLALANGVKASEYGCTACQGDPGWSGEAKLDEIGNPNANNATAKEALPGLSTVQKSRVAKWNKPLQGFADENSSQKNSPANGNQEDTANVTKNSTSNGRKDSEDDSPIIRSANARIMLAPLNDVSSADVLLDISENVTKHIPGSIAVPYTRFLNGTSLKTEPELVKILGDAGISRQDPVVVYGECMPCGGGPAPATFVYWMLKSLGQENVRVLDGTVTDMEAAGKPVTEEAVIKVPKIFESQVDPEYTANFDYVENGSDSGSVQIIDARTVREFGEGSIPKALNIPDASVIEGSKIANEAKLEKVFASLVKNKPVVVYTNTGIKASVVWFALIMQGYEAKLYSYEDWLKNMKVQSKVTA